MGSISLWERLIATDVAQHLWAQTRRWARPTLLPVRFRPAQNFAYRADQQCRLFPSGHRPRLWRQLCAPNVIHNAIQLPGRADDALAREYVYVAGFPDKAPPRCAKKRNQRFLAGSQRTWWIIEEGSHSVALQPVRQRTPGSTPAAQTATGARLRRKTRT